MVLTLRSYMYKVFTMLATSLVDWKEDDGDKIKTMMLNLYMITTIAGVSGIPCLVVCKKDGTLVTKDGRAGVTSMVIINNFI